MHASWLKPRHGSEPAQDHERARAGQATTPCVQEQLGTMPTGEMGASSRQVAPECFDRLPANRNDPLLVALSGNPHKTVIEIDAVLRQAHRLGHPQAGAVEQLDKRTVAKRARRDASGRSNQPFGLARRECLR